MHERHGRQNAELCIEHPLYASSARDDCSSVSGGDCGHVRSPVVQPPRFLPLLHLPRVVAIVLCIAPNGAVPRYASAQRKSRSSSDVVVDARTRAIPTYRAAVGAMGVASRTDARLICTRNVRQDVQKERFVRIAVLHVRLQTPHKWNGPVGCQFLAKYSRHELAPEAVQTPRCHFQHWRSA